jgi:hypothetical protein
MFTFCMNMTSKGESPRERPRPRPRPRPRQKLLKYVNEVMPVFTSRPSSPRLRIDPTKGNVDMHFEKIAIEVDPVDHELFQEVPNRNQNWDFMSTNQKKMAPLS